MTVLVIDTGSHATNVMAAVREWYNGPIRLLDVGSTTATQKRLRDLLYEAVAIASNEIVHGVNLSYGGGNTLDAARARDIDFDHPIEDLFKMNIPVALAAGNAGLQYIHGVSHIGSSPFNLTVSALKDGRTADYTQQGAWLTDGYADGTINGSMGTSFASPRLLGAFAEHKRLYNKTLPEIRSCFERTARQFHDTLRIGSALERDFLNQSSAPIDNRMIIDAFYEVIIGRQPEEGAAVSWAFHTNEYGLDTVLLWMENIAQSAGDYGHSWVPIADRVQSLYHLILHREADLGGMASWINAIVERKFDYEGDRVRRMDVDWRKVYEAFLWSAENAGETVYHKDIVQRYINASNVADINAMNVKEHVEPELYGQC